MTAKEKIENYLAKALETFRKLSKREKVLIIVPSVFLVIFILYSLILTPVVQAFSKQQEELTEARVNLEVLSTMLEKYGKLKSRRQEIEEQYKEIEIKESG